jgi:ElaB/YqjD/DUF883 family membrane-anchored ribosome-binding protein
MNTNENLSQSQIARQRTAEDLRQLLHDAEQMIAATRHDGSERLHAVRERLESSARQVREAFYDGERALFEQAREGAQRADAYVHVHPWSTMTVAAGAALVIGWMMGRR